MTEEDTWKDNKIHELLEIIRKDKITIAEQEEIIKLLQDDSIKTADEALPIKLAFPLDLWRPMLNLYAQDKPIVFLVQDNKIYNLL